MNRMRLMIIGILCAGAAAAGIFFAVNAGRRASPSAEFRPSKISAAAYKLETEGNLIAARDAYQQIIIEHAGDPGVLSWQKKVEDINLQLLFSPTITPGSVQYEIVSGDSLEKIARDHKTTVELIKRCNNMSSDNIFPGRKIKVWNAPFNILVDKSQNILMLKCDDDIIKTYTVATGKNNCTPIGTFRIIEKIVNPPWFKPGGKMIPHGDPENILGTRWMGLNKESYGIHGTMDPKSLGLQATAGCVRMRNAEVEELYSIVPVGTEVTIID